jgi:hypothetical protein
MTESVEALKAAKYHAEKADATASKTDIGLSIAFALIAICERLDRMTDKESNLDFFRHELRRP